MEETDRLEQDAGGATEEIATIQVTYMKEINDIHRPFMKWLNERRIPYIYHRADRRSGIQSGHPDFTVLWMRRNIMIECKTPAGRLGPAQLKRIEFLRRSGNVVEIARNLSECVEAVQNILCEGKPAVSVYGACNYPLEECFKELKRAVSKVPGNGKEDLSGGVESRHADQKSGYGSEINSLSCSPKNGTRSGSSAPPAQNTLIQQPPADRNEEGQKSANSFYIGDWQGTPYVFAPDQDGAYRMIRHASAIDLANLPKLSDDAPELKHDG